MRLRYPISDSELLSDMKFILNVFNAGFCDNLNNLSTSFACPSGDTNGLRFKATLKMKSFTVYLLHQTPNSAAEIEDI